MNIDVDYVGQCGMFLCYAILSQNLSCKGKVSDAKIKDFKNCKNGT